MVRKPSAMEPGAAVGDEAFALRSEMQPKKVTRAEAPRPSRFANGTGAPGSPPGHRAGVPGA